jgi:hypothetical protein
VNTELPLASRLASEFAVAATEGVLASLASVTAASWIEPLSMHAEQGSPGSPWGP